MTVNFSRGAGEVVAGDIRAAFANADEALLSSARMYVSVIETTRGSALPVGHSQKLFATITGSIGKAVESRADLIEAVRQMTAIKERSSLAMESYGCPTGHEMTTAVAVVRMSGEVAEA